jgi:enterochelin esterase family protein
MKPYLALLLVLLCWTASAQEKRPEPPAPVVSPEIGADGHVTFRLKAPQAQAVLLRGQWGKDPLPLAKGADGVWAAAAEAVPTGVWEYSFVVDGLTMIDPGNPAMKPMREPRTSILQLPSTPPAVWDFQDVPHGTVHTHSYLSKTLGRARELLVYTPPGYEKEAAAHYPLLVLQHGSGDNQQTWVAHGKANWILDNLIAAGRARPMVVLMLDGHPLGAMRFGDPAKRQEALEAFQHELLDDALPLVESLYRVEQDPASRAIAGLSMGGMQSLTTGLGHLGKFAWVGSFSGVPPEEPVLNAFLADPAAANAKLKLLWIAVGKDDFLRTRNEAFVAQLNEKGIHHEWQLSEGAHAWPVWRNYLAEFAPLLFQPAKP